MRVGHDVDIVEVLVVRGGIAVLQCTGVLGLQVLVERAAKRHVDELQAPADTENGFAHFGKRFHHGQVVEVAHTVAQPLLAQRLLAVTAGPHVSATVHDHTVQPLGIVRQRHIAARGLARGAGHHDHHGPGGHDPVRNGLLDILQGLASEQRARGVGVLEAG